jgi:hypothetical protein
MPGANLLVAVGTNGTVLRGTVNGDQVRWDPPTRPVDQNLRGVAVVPGANLLVAVGVNGTVLRGTVNGDQVRWDLPTQPSEQMLIGIAAVPSTKLLVAVGGKGTVLRSDELAANWAPQLVHSSALLHAVIGLSDHFIVAVGSEGPMVSIGTPERVVSADGYRFETAGDQLTFAWRYPADKPVKCGAASYDIIGTKERGRALDRTALQSLKESRGRIAYSVTWSPSDFGIAPVLNSGILLNVLMTFTT